MATENMYMYMKLEKLNVLVFSFVDWICFFKFHIKNQMTGIQRLFCWSIHLYVLACSYEMYFYMYMYMNNYCNMMKLQKSIFSLLSSTISIRYIWIIHYTCRLKDVNRRRTEEKERFVEENQKPLLRTFVRCTQYNYTQGLIELYSKHTCYRPNHSAS